MATYKKTTFSLSAQGIDEASDYLAAELGALKVPSRDALRLRLSVEEILLKYHAAEGMAQTFDVELTRRFKRLNITLRCAGASLDPLLEDENEDFGSNLLGRSMLRNLGLSPAWEYRNGVNTVAATQKLGKKRSQLTNVFYAVVLAVALGLLGTLLPPSAKSFIMDSLIDPVFNGFLSTLSCIVGPMMFLSMVWGIFNIGDTKQLGVIGKRLLTRFMIVSTLVGILCIAAALVFFRLPIGTGSGGGDIVKALVEMLIGIIPKNIVEPFSSGNMLQILCMGTVVGVAMILMRDRMQTMSNIVEQSNAIVQSILSAIGSMVPAFIFLSVLRLILQGTLAQNMSGLLGLILLSVAITVVETAVEILTMLKLGLSPARVLKKISALCLTALSTASSAASYPILLDCGENKMGVDSKLANFALPFGSVVFMPHVVNTLITIPLFAANVYGVEITTGSLVLCLINAVVLSVAAPPIPGGILSCYTLMFMQLGIPLEGLSLAVAANVVLDFTATYGNLTDLVIQLAHGAKKMGMLDETVLKS